MSAPTPPTTAGTSPDRSRRAGGHRPGDRSRRRRWVLGGLAALLVLTLVGVAPILQRAAARDGAAAAVDGDRVELVGSRFTPSAVRVGAGASVTFVWTDGVEHDVRFDAGPSEGTRADGTWSRTFDEPGTYPFRCTLHPFMDGRVEVTG